MANIISLLLGLIALILAIPGIVPLLGWLNWLVLMIAGLGLLLGMVSSSDVGRNFCIFVLIVGGLRLWLGGGFF
jgi:hypothetical protein